MLSINDPRMLPETVVPIFQRFAQPVSSGCWQWTGPIDRKGYGDLRVSVERKWRHLKAHRVAYLLHRGPIPDGLCLDHLCRNRACVNPDHLEPVTNRENLMRGEGIGAHFAARSHCNHGHPWDSKNTGVRKDGTRTKRYCRECKRLTDQGLPRNAQPNWSFP